MSLKNKTIPTIIGLALVATSSLLGGYLITTSRQGEKIQAEEKPQAVKITNISDHSFTVSWLTLRPSKGALKLNEEKGEIFLDQRDVPSGQSKSYLTHYVVVDQLAPNRKYRFELLINEKLYTEESFVVQTAAPVNTTPPPADFAFGLVLDSQEKPLPDVIVFLSLPNATPISSLTDQEGKWSIPLGTTYRQDLSDLLQYNPQNQIVEITAVASYNLTATQQTTTRNLHPAPPIILGKSSSFVSPPPAPTNPPLSSPSPTPTSSSFTIHNPDEGEVIKNLRPQIEGKAPNGTKIKIKIQSSPQYEAEIIADSSGSWQYIPPQNLAPGEHTLTVEYIDENNQKQTITRHFIVRAASVSPSPTPIPPLPTQTPTPAPLTPTPLPTIKLPTATPLPTRQLPTSTPATTAANLETGSPVPLAILLLLSSTLLITAFFVF